MYAFVPYSELVPTASAPPPPEPIRGLPPHLQKLRHLVIDSIFDKQDYSELGTHEFCVTLANDPSYRCLFFEYFNEELKTRELEVFRVLEKEKSKDPTTGAEKEMTDDDFFGAGSER